MSDFFSKFNIKTNQTVGVSVTVNNRVEMVQVDKATKKIMKYASRELSYNTSLREISDYDDFREVLQGLFRELGLNPKKCNVVLTLPSVFFGFISLPSILTDDAITSALVSEVEQEYLFKKNNPVVSWVEVAVDMKKDVRYIAYSALQEGAVLSIQKVFGQVGCTLSATENSNFSLLKALLYSDLAREEVEKQMDWTVLSVGSNNLTVYAMKGEKLIKSFENPLAISTFTSNEVYDAICGSANSILRELNTQTLFVISETDAVSSEILANRLKAGVKTKNLDRNVFTSECFMDSDYAVLSKYLPFITLESVGAAVYFYENFNFKFNFLTMKDLDGSASFSIVIGGVDFEVNKQFIQTLCLGIILVFGAFYVILTSVFNNLNNSYTTAIQALDLEFKTLSEQIGVSKNKDVTMDIFSIMNQLSIQNALRNSYFNALSVNIPPEVWVTNFYADSTGAIGISGSSTSVDGIYTFYKSIKESVKNSDVILSGLQYADDENFMYGRNQIYNFSLSNPKYQEYEARLLEGLEKVNKLQDEFLNPTSSTLNVPVSPQQSSQAATNRRVVPDTSRPAAPNRRVVPDSSRPAGPSMPDRSDRPEPPSLNRPPNFVPDQPMTPIRPTKK